MGMLTIAIEIKLTEIEDRCQKHDASSNPMVGARYGVRGAYVSAELNHQFSETAKSSQLKSSKTIKLAHDKRATQRRTTESVLEFVACDDIENPFAGPTSL